MKKYILKEYGAWGIMLLSYLAGTVVAGTLNTRAAAGLIALGLFVNSKQALILWIRRTGPKGPAVVFLAQIAAGASIFLSIIGGDFPRLLPYAAVPVAYIFLLLFAGEHSIFTELTGFVLLSLSALISRYLLTAIVDPKIFISAAFFFTAGVFKVRARLRKGRIERTFILAHALFSALVYYVLRIPLVLLSPLADNLVFAAVPYKMKLKTAGWVEVAKGVAFVILIAMEYQ